MRVESSVTSISWLPSEAVRGSARLPFDVGVAHYDDPPPDVLDDIDALHARGAFRFANGLSAWIEVEDGRVVAHGYSGRSYISPTLMRLGQTEIAFQPTAFPDLRSDPEVTGGSVRFTQTSGGRPGVPAPRVVRGKPFMQWLGPNVWTTLSLTIDADGTAGGELVGASTIPRHWVYDAEARLVAKSGSTDFKNWYRRAFGPHSPWGDEDSPAFVAMAESALERQMSATIMRGGPKPRTRRLAAGTTLVEQGQAGHEMYLLLDGMLAVEVNGERVGEVGPGAVVGERALLEGGDRTSTLLALTDCHVAIAREDQIERSALQELAESHHREDA